MHSATLSSKFQICIPKEIREELHIKAGQTFIFIPHGNSIQLVPERNIEELRGIMAGSNTMDIRDRRDRNE
jgi:AbrB family looped-hinge helix DNA binding protein